VAGAGPGAARQPSSRRAGPDEERHRAHVRQLDGGKQRSLAWQREEWDAAHGESEYVGDAAGHGWHDPPLLFEADALAPRRQQRIRAQAESAPAAVEPPLDAAAAVDLEAAHHLGAVFV